MEFSIRQVDLDEFFKEMYEDIQRYIDEEEKKNTSCSDEKCRFKYKYEKQEPKDDDKKTIEKLESKLKARDQMIARLEKDINDLNNKMTAEDWIKSESVNNSKIINDKILSDGYKILNDIQVYIEFVRKCGRLNNNGFIDMINRIDKLVTGFIESRNPKC